MKLSPGLQVKFETFFRRFFDDEDLTLPNTEIHVKFGAKVITGILDVDGITLGPHIFIRPGLAENVSNRSLRVAKSLLVHELTHVLQYQRSGYAGFLIGYVGEFLTGLKKKRRLDPRSRMEAYLEISHEIEARAAAQTFNRWENGWE